eukprot:400138_1
MTSNQSLLGSKRIRRIIKNPKNRWITENNSKTVEWIRNTMILFEQKNEQSKQLFIKSMRLFSGPDKNIFEKLDTLGNRTIRRAYRNYKQSCEETQKQPPYWHYNLLKEPNEFLNEILIEL